jgi:hypothetical protein
MHAFVRYCKIISRYTIDVESSEEAAFLMAEKLILMLTALPLAYSANAPIFRPDGLSQQSNWSLILEFVVV